MPSSKSEIRDYGKINFDFLLLDHISNINKQLSKLPHENVLPNMNEPIGTTRADILNSYVDMVEHLEELLAPYHDGAYTALQMQTAKDFLAAKKKFGELMRLCDRLGFLFTKVRIRARADEGVFDEPNIE